MAELISIAQHTVSPELRALVEGARPRIAKVAASIARSYRLDNADDLAQLAMVKAIELAPDYDPKRGASFDTFIFRTARRVMLEACLVEQRDRVVAEAVARGTRAVHETLDAGDPFSEDEAARRERLTDARDAIAASAILGMFTSPGTPEDLLILEQERAGLTDRMQSALARLEEKDRALVWSCVCEGCSVASVVETLGLDYDSARYRLRVALRTLNKWLKAA